MVHASIILSIFFFNDTATTEIYTLSLHDALPIWKMVELDCDMKLPVQVEELRIQPDYPERSEEHTSELQSPYDLVCRLLLEKKKEQIQQYNDVTTFHLRDTSERQYRRDSDPCITK